MANSKNKNLGAAKAAKKDEFYTSLPAINDELYYYTTDREDLGIVNQFKGKTVFCNCDDPEWSAFWEYFILNFHAIGLKKLISTHYEPSGSPSYKMEYTGKKMNGQQVWVKTDLQGNGDFRSQECIEILKETDIVVTNPPFSLFRDYVGQLLEMDKKFIIIGPMSAITYKGVFPLLMTNKMWCGYGFNKTMEFIMPPDYVLKGKAFIDEQGRKHGFVPGICWYTNLDVKRNHEPYPVCDYYYGNEAKYPKYATIDGIDVKCLDDIPCDYEGIMGVPKSFMGVYCPEQFELLGYEREDEIVKAGIGNMPADFLATYRAQGGKGHYTRGMKMLCFYDNAGNAKIPFSRILIRNKNPQPKKGGIA